MGSIELKEVSFTYPDGTNALDSVSFTVEKGVKTFIHGLNGAGKTTLFQCMNGLLKPEKGQVYINGSPCTEKQLMKKVGIVFQNADDQMIAGSVYEELSFGLMNMGLSKEAAKKKIDLTIEEFELQDLQDKPPHFLSYGQKKRVSIASICAMEPEIIIFDEPTANLDSRQTENVLEIFDKLKNKGVTILVSTHDIDISWRCAEHIISLSKGRVFMTGPPEKLFLNDDFIAEMGINRPVLLDLYNSMAPKGPDYYKLSFPKTRGELIKLIQERNICL